MPKHTPFFKFDAMEWLGGSIQTCTLDEKGLFIDICALYWKDYKPVKIDTKFKVRYRNLEGTLSNLIGTLSDLGLIEVFEAEITVPFLDALMDDREKFLAKCSKAGKKSRLVQGTSSNKKEERRKKKEECREKKEEKREEIKEGAQAHNPVSDLLWFVIDVIEDKHNVSKRNDQQWIRYLQNDLKRMQIEDGISPERIEKAMGWYRKNEFFTAVDSGRTLRGNFSKLETAMNNADPFKAFKI